MLALRPRDGRWSGCALGRDYRSLTAEVSKPVGTALVSRQSVGVGPCQPGSIASAWQSLRWSARTPCSRPLWRHGRDRRKATWYAIVIVRNDHGRQLRWPG